MRAELQNAFERFARLDAWGRDLSDVELRVGRTRLWYSTGTAVPGRVTILAGRDPADGRAILLHELSHIAATRRLRGWQREPDHGAKWREMYVMAVAEVTGFSIHARGRLVRDLDEQALMAMRAHLKRRA